MTTYWNRRRRKLGVIVLTAIASGAVAALGVAVAPDGLREALVTLLGVPALIPEAAPPLGDTARLLLAVGVFAAVTIAVGALMLTLVARSRPRRRALMAPRPTTPEIVADEEGEETEIEAETEAESPSRPTLFGGEAPSEPEARIAAEAEGEPDELVLDAEAPAEPAGPSPAVDDPALPQPAPAPMPPRPPLTGEEPIPDLIDRLEAGLQRRAALQGSNDAALRDALGSLRDAFR